MSEEKLQIDYDYLIEYLEDPQNVIGATTSTTLRNLTSHNDGNSIYVRKFGIPYEIKDVTDIEDPVDVNMTFKVHALDGTLLGSRIGGGAFVDGAAVNPAQACYLEIEASGGNVVVLAGIDIDTDVDAGGLTLVCAAETITDGDTLRLYLAYSGSTYYDTNYIYGGARHVPDSSSRFPYLTIAEAIVDPDTTGFTICTVLDSATYDEQFSVSIAGMILQTDEGHIATLAHAIGARVTRESEYFSLGSNFVWSNANGRFVNKTGNDANDGTWQNPFLTLAHTITNLGGKNVVYGGAGASVTAVFKEAVTVTTNYWFSTEYGYMPTISGQGLGAVNLITMSATGAQVGVRIRGWTFDGENEAQSGLYLSGAITNAGDWWCADCTFLNCTYGVYKNPGTAYLRYDIVNNIIYNCFYGIYFSVTGTPASPIMTGNEIYSCTKGIFVTSPDEILPTVTHNIIYNNIEDGARFVRTDFGGFEGVFSNNVVFGNSVGFYAERFILTPIGTIVDNNIFHTNSTYGIETKVGNTLTCRYCNFFNNGTAYSAGVTSNNEISGDPKLCDIVSPYKFGISSNSPCYRADAANEDIGPLIRHVEINASNIEVNGFNIDGQSLCNNGLYILDSVDHTGFILKWCSVHDYQGIAIDLYDDDSNIDASLNNSKLYYNGDGVKFSYGGNTMDECLFYKNAAISIYSNNVSHVFNHFVVFGSRYGLYFDSASRSVSIKNFISHSNSSYGIYSEVSMSVTYACITDSTLNVDASHSSNFIDDPLFKNEVTGSEDFNIKTRFGNFSIDSPCYLTADDSKDIGAYDVTRTIEEEGWKKYVLETNPSNMNIEDRPNGEIRFSTALGSRSLWAKAHKLSFPLEWDMNAYSTEEQKDKIRYIKRLIPKRETGKTKGQCRLRLRLQPASHLFDGTNGVINADVKTLTDTGISLTEDKYKGFFMGIIFTSGSGMVIDASAKTGTKGGAGWVVDEHIGQYLKYNGYTYYIKSNSATVLTLSDPYSTLLSGTIIYSIEKYFEIDNHDDSVVFNLLDDNAELTDGTYNYYIDFAQVRVMDSGFSYTQPRFAYSREEWKTGYNLRLEQI